MGHTDLQNYVATERGQYILAKALAQAAHHFHPSDDAKEMATVLTKYFPQFPELLKTNVISDVILENNPEVQLTFWEAMAEVAWSSTDDKDE